MTTAHSASLFRRTTAALLSTVAVVAAALMVGPTPSASAATTSYGVEIPVADWGGRAVTTLTQYQDSSGAYHRWLLTPGVDVRGLNGPASQRIEVRYVLERRTPESASQGNGWVELQSDTRWAEVTGDEKVHLRSQNFAETGTPPVRAEYRYVFHVTWYDAATNQVLAQARVQPIVKDDASCLQLTHIPCNATDSGTIYSGAPSF